MADGNDAIAMTRRRTSQARDKASSPDDETPGEERNKSSMEGSEKRRHRWEMKGAMDVDGLEEEVVRRRDAGEGSGMAGRRWRKVKNVISMSSSLVRCR